MHHNIFRYFEILKMFLRMRLTLRKLVDGFLSSVLNIQFRIEGARRRFVFDHVLSVAVEYEMWRQFVKRKIRTGAATITQGVPVITLHLANTYLMQAFKARSQFIIERSHSFSFTVLTLLHVGTIRWLALRLFAR